MPTRAQKKCPRCGNPYSGRRCPECFKRGIKTLGLRTQTDKPDPYKSKQWIAFSREYLREHITCECPDCKRLPEILRPKSRVTDHKDGLGPLGPRGFDVNNMQAMSIPCHGRKTARFDGGFGHKRKQWVE